MKPFHIFSFLLCVVDIVQDIGLAVPVHCNFALGLLLVGCVAKVTLAAWFVTLMYFLTSTVSTTQLDRIFRHFVSIGFVCGLIPLLSGLFLWMFGDFWDEVCDRSNFAHDLRSPVTTRTAIVFSFCIILPATISYTLFISIIVLMIRKLGVVQVTSIVTQMKLRFIFSGMMFGIGMIPGILAIIIFIFSHHATDPFIDWVRITGICICSQGFFYLILFFLNIPLTDIFPRTAKQKLVVASPNLSPPALGQLLHQPAWSESWIVSYHSQRERDSFRESESESENVTVVSSFPQYLNRNVASFSQNILHQGMGNFETESNRGSDR